MSLNTPRVVPLVSTTHERDLPEVDRTRLVVFGGDQLVHSQLFGDDLR